MKELAEKCKISDAGLSKADEEQRQMAGTERYVVSWKQPPFHNSFKNRRLRRLNAIFTALERERMKF